MKSDLKPAVTKTTATSARSLTREHDGGLRAGDLLDQCSTVWMLQESHEPGKLPREVTQRRISLCFIDWIGLLHRIEDLFCNAVQNQINTADSYTLELSERRRAKGICLKMSPTYVLGAASISAFVRGGGLGKCKDKMRSRRFVD